MSFLSSLWNRTKENDSPEDNEKKEVKELEITFEDSDDEQEEISMGEVKYSKGNMSINVIDARQFVKTFRNWAFNRELNEEHVAELKCDLLKSTSPQLMGTIKVVSQIQTGSYPPKIRIIDGQHRYTALESIINNNTKFNMDIVLEIYYVSDIDGPDTWRLFDNANKCLNVNMKDKTMSLASYVVTELSKEFPDAVYDPKGSGGRVNYPHIDRKALFERLKRSDVFKHASKEEVYNSILAKNIELSKKDIKSIVSVISSKTDKEKVERGYRRCYKTGCYLGVSMIRFDWLTEIEVEMRKN